MEPFDNDDLTFVDKVQLDAFETSLGLHDSCSLQELLKYYDQEIARYEENGSLKGYELKKLSAYRKLVRESIMSRSQGSPKSILDLPLEVLVMVLSKLPELFDLIEAKLVCKRFKEAASLVRVSTLCSAEADLPPSLLKNYLDPKSKRLCLRFERRECIEFPPNLRQAIDENAMPNLKKLYIYDGVLHHDVSNSLPLPKCITHLAFYRLGDMRHISILSRQKLLPTDLECLEVYFTKRPTKGTRINIYSNILPSFIKKWGAERRPFEVIGKAFYSEEKEEAIITHEEFAEAMNRIENVDIAWCMVLENFVRCLRGCKILGMKCQQLESARLTIFIE